MFRFNIDKDRNNKMDAIAHKYLTKLRIISKIPENGQLDLTNNDLNIYFPSIVNWIYRKIKGDGKMNTVEEGETKYKFEDGDYVFSNRTTL